MNTTRTQFSDDQLLQAFRYVAGEFSADESEVFEQQMLEDQSLCDSVVRASSLSCLIASADQSQRAVPTVRLVDGLPAVAARRTYAVWVTSLSACLCLFMLAAIYSTGSGQQSSIAANLRHDDAEFLVSVWASGGVESSDTSLEDSELSQAELEVPDWLLAAVAISDQDDLVDDGMEL